MMVVMVLDYGDDGGDDDNDGDDDGGDDGGGDDGDDVSTKYFVSLSLTNFPKIPCNDLQTGLQAERIAFIYNTFHDVHIILQFPSVFLLDVFQ
jgi:hypothetical protein